MSDSVTIRAFDLLDKHPAILVTLLLVAGGMAITFGIRFPQRVKQEDGTTNWQLSGGVPGLGSGLVALAQGLLKFAATFAAERERDRNAHKEELLAQRTAIDSMASTVKELVAKLGEIAQIVKPLIALQNRIPPERASTNGIACEATSPR